MTVTSASRAVPPPASPPSVIGSAPAVLQHLTDSCLGQLPEEFFKFIQRVLFATSSPGGGGVYFPCPLKEQEAVSALKALEGCAAAAIADLRYGKARRTVEVDVDKAACFLMSAYLATVDGYGKGDPRIKNKLPKTDLNEAQSVLYRRLSANMYETNTGDYYHIHGSLDATRTLRMVGLKPYRPELTEYQECISTIEAAVKRFSVPDLEEMNSREGQAGVPVLRQEEFRKTPHGKALASQPPLTVRLLEGSTPPVPFGSPLHRVDYMGQILAPQCLQGIKVLELCRIIAGPTIGRSLAAHGASVLKVTSSQLPDVPFFQVDVNTGKHTTNLHLRNEGDRRIFERLVADADVLIDGYRPGALARLGYGPEALAARAKKRGRGFVYVAEDCFGGAGVPGAEWSHRPGWQQIADCATGVAWEQGRFMGVTEPVVPPFPMSDYGTGALGCVAALAGLYWRAVRGGSWLCRTSLAQYDLFLLSLGAYPAEVQERLRRAHDTEFFALRHHDSVDEVSRRALRSMRMVAPHLFAGGMMHAAWSEGFGAELRWPREAVRVRGLRIGHSRPSRPNGFDPPSWDCWEEDEELVSA